MDRKPVISNYENAFNEDNRAFGTRAEQIEFIYTKKLLDEHISPGMSVIELGCATGYYGIYLSGKCRSYHGVDLTPKHIDQFNAKISAQNLTNISASVGDATNLFQIQDQSFDAVLVFGPMYHLPREERQKVFQESKRICKPGGVIMFAYINKIGAYLRACLDDRLNANYPNKKSNEWVLRHSADDILPDVFYFTMPEEMEADAIKHGLTILQNKGVDFVFSDSNVNNMTDDKYEAWAEIMDYMFHSPSCTGASNHAVLVCHKK